MMWPVTKTDIESLYAKANRDIGGHVLPNSLVTQLMIASVLVEIKELLEKMQTKEDTRG